MHRPVPVIAFALLALCGCAHRDAPVANLSEYQNAAQDAARRENAAAVALIDAGDLDAAAKRLRLAIAADPTFGPAHNNLGHLFFLQAKPYEAATAFGQAARLMPRQAEPQNNLGLVFESAGRLDEAVECYARAVGLEPANLGYLANETRARVRRGERSTNVREALARIAAGNLAPEWSAWARQTLADWRGPAAETPARPADR